MIKKKFLMLALIKINVVSEFKICLQFITPRKVYECNVGYRVLLVWILFIFAIDVSKMDVAM